MLCMSSRPAIGRFSIETLLTATTGRGSRYLSSQPANQRIPGFAFAFDIDGVLLRSADPIPGAAEAVRYLQSNRIPSIFLTNGGGKTEAKRVEDLNNKLALPKDHQIKISQLIQSHTPLSELATAHGDPSYKDKTVLVVGGDGDKCRQVAHSYGFTRVITPGDIYSAYPEISPFSSNFASYYSTFAKPLPLPVNPESVKPGQTDGNSLKIDVIFVFNDPRDWQLDCQLILDIMLSHRGLVGTYSPLNGDKSRPDHGYQSDGQPELYFSNPDLLWASAYPLSRLGQGGFREALLGVWRAVTKSKSGEEIPLKYTILGKPHRLTYEYAEKMLVKFRQQSFGKDIETRVPLKKVYMVGDNPESDIMGANNYKSLVGAEWNSLLTKTGVFAAREGEEPSVKPTRIVDDVRDGVRWALRDSEWDGKIE